MNLRRIHPKMVELDLSSFDDMREDIATLQEYLEQLQRDLEGVSQNQLEIINARIEELKNQLESSKYTHPETHPASIITQDANNRFTTDLEKNDWNKAKSDVSDIQNEISAVKGRLSFLEQSSGGGVSDVKTLLREVANLKLRQEAGERIDGGVLFGDDMNKGRFGMTYKTDESSDIIIRGGKMMMANGDGITTEETNIKIGGSTTVGSPSHTGGRKVAILDSGEIYMCGTQGTGFILYSSIDNGKTWIQKQTIPESGSALYDCAIDTDGEDIYVIWCAGTSVTSNGIYFRKFGTKTNAWKTNPFYLKSNRPEFSNSKGNDFTVNIAVNRETKEFHIVLCAKFSSHTNSYNINHVVGTVASDASITVGASKMITTLTDSYEAATKPHLIITEDKKLLVFFSKTYRENNFTRYAVFVSSYDGSDWSEAKSLGGGYNAETSFISAIHAPSNITRTNNGRIWVTWQANEANNTTHIPLYYSDDKGATFKSPFPDGKLVETGGSQPTITVNKDNEVLISLIMPDSFIHTYKSKDGVTFTANKTTITPLRILSYGYSFLHNYANPPLTYLLNQSSGVYARLEFAVGSESHVLNSIATYNLPETDYVGMYVKKIGDVNITAYINGNMMKSDLVGDEYEFTGSLATKQPVTIRLNLSRSSAEGRENDAVTTIIGGRA